MIRLTLVSNLTPTLPVSEYGLYLATALSEVMDVIVLTDKNAPEIEHGCLDLHRIYNYGSHLTPIRLMSEIKRSQPDCVMYNVTLGAFGSSTANFASMMTLPVLRMLGVPTIVLLHNMVEEFNGNVATILRLGAQAATWIITRSGEVCVLRQEYSDLLRSKYHAQYVHLVPHGMLGNPKAKSLPGTKEILSFGIYGTHKRLENLLEAMTILLPIDPVIKLKIVGGSNSHNPRYYHEVHDKYGHLPNVDWFGYVPEDMVQKVFTESEVVILTNCTNGGESGVLIQAGMYARPVIASDIPLFRNKMSEGYRLKLVDISNPSCIAEAIFCLLHDEEEKLAQSVQNFEASIKYSMGDVAKIYLGIIEHLVEERNANKQTAPSHRSRSLS